MGNPIEPLPSLIIKRITINPYTDQYPIQPSSCLKQLSGSACFDSYQPDPSASPDDTNVSHRQEALHSFYEALYYRSVVQAQNLHNPSPQSSPQIH